MNVSAYEILNILQKRIGQYEMLRQDKILKASKADILKVADRIMEAAEALKAETDREL